LNTSCITEVERLFSSKRHRLRQSNISGWQLRLAAGGRTHYTRSVLESGRELKPKAPLVLHSHRELDLPRPKVSLKPACRNVKEIAYHTAVEHTKCIGRSYAAASAQRCSFSRWIATTPLQLHLHEISRTLQDVAKVYAEFLPY